MKTQLQIQQKKNRPVHNISMYWTNFWDSRLLMYTIIFFEKALIEACSRHLYASFWHLLRPHWSIIWGTVSLWSMFENRQLAVFEGKFFRSFKDSLCCEQWTNLDAKGAKRSVKMSTTSFYKSFFKIVQFMHMLCPGRFILVESVPKIFKFW